MIQLRPTESFVIARQIDDPHDTGTYYIQAKVRNATTDELLKTINLTDQGDQRFRGNYEIPVDASGLGFFITITSRVYTDSGYTSESELYGVEEREYLVQERWNQSVGSGGGSYGAGSSFKGGGTDIDYKKIRNIVEDEIEKIVFPKQILPKAVDLSGILNGIDNIWKKVKKLENTDLKQVNFKEVVDEVKDSKRSLEKKIDDNTKSLEKYKGTFKKAGKDVDGLMSRIKDFINSDIGDVNKNIEELKKDFNKIPFVSVVGAMPKEEVEKKEETKNEEPKIKRRLS